MAYIKPATWYNADGLGVDLGIDEARYAKVTEFEHDGPVRVVEIVIADASVYNATDEYVLSDRFTLPVGAIVTEVSVGPNSTAFASSGGGTISIGTVLAGFATGDIDSLLALASVSEMNAGGTAAGDGVLVQGAALTAEQYLTLSVDTAVFQSGAAVVYVYYTIPKVEGETLVYSKA